MKRRLIGALAILLVSVAMAFQGSAQEVDKHRVKAEATLKSEDANGDGKLSKEEFRKEKLFDLIDSNRDGFVTVQEDVAYRAHKSSGNKGSKADKRAVRERHTEHDGDTRIEHNIIYAAVGERKLPLDLYIPEKAKANGKSLPVVLWFHGGGWKGGSKGSGGIARGLVDEGYAVASVEYRLSGEALFPAQVEDSKSAVRWVRANAKEYGLDPDNIGVMGRSAGGHLVAFLGTTGDTTQYDTESNQGYSSRVQAVVDCWGVTDLLQMDAQALPGGKFLHDSAESPEGRLVGGPIQEEPYRSLAVKVNPIGYIKRGNKLPPFLMVHGDSDTSVPVGQSMILHKALQKVGADTTLHIEKGAGHGLKGGEMDYDELREMAARFFDKHLKSGR
jgi:acetyl esterase/lipase